MEDPMPSLRTFVAALGNLEGVLEEHVLQKKTLEAHLSALSEQQLSPLEKAQSATMLAYLVYDSIWMWLRTQGVDPSKHPVLHELDRIKTYFAKIQSAERAPPPMKLDKAAATRLLRQPLKDAQSPSASSNASRPSHSGHDIGVNSRFNAVTYHDQASDKAKAKTSERNAFQSQHSDSDSDSDPDPDLEVFNGSTSLASHTPTSSSAQSLHRPTEPSVASDPKTESRGKRKRTKSHNTSSSGPPTAGDQPGAKRRRKRKNKTGKTTQ